VVDGAKVRILAGEPFRTGPVGGQGDVEPHVELVFLGQVEEAVEIVELVPPRRRFHPVPEAEGADDAQAGGAYARKVGLPHIGSWYGCAVVLDADGEGRVGMLQKIRHWGSRVRRSWSVVDAGAEKVVPGIGAFKAVKRSRICEQ